MVSKMAKKNLSSAAAAATDKMFSSNGKSGDKSVFSFRCDKNSIKKWRRYAGILKLSKGIRTDELWSAAINEYIEKHPLEGAEKTMFEEK